MKWNKITSVQDLSKIVEQSQDKPVFIFKHSTRCSISSMALGRLERDWEDTNAELVAPYYLDLIAHRDLSGAISENFNVAHESPQVLVIKKGECSYNNSHMGIQLKEIISEVSK